MSALFQSFEVLDCRSRPQEPRKILWQNLSFVWSNNEELRANDGSRFHTRKNQRSSASSSIRKQNISRTQTRPGIYRLIGLNPQKIVS